MTNPNFKDEITNRLVSILKRQEESGLATYGQTLQDAHDTAYDWKIMAIEELIDSNKYLIKEIMRLEKIVSIFKDALEWEGIDADELIKAYLDSKE